MPMGLDIGTSFASTAARARPPACAQPDADAAAYVAAVEAADGQALEQGVKDAITAFVAGCKADGVWNAVGAACVLAGARTLAGALTPLKGPAPTNVNFVAGDYDRRTGLKGDAATKYLDSNRAGDADPLTDFHAAVWQTGLQTGAGSTFGPLIASRPPSNFINSSQIIDSAEDGNYQVIARDVPPTEIGFRTPRVANRLVAMSLSGATLTMRYADALDATTIAAVGSVPTTWQVLGRGDGERHSDARVAFYSVGAALDLAALDARVAALMTAIGEAVA